MTLKQIPIIAGEDRWMPTWPSSIIGESGNLCGDGKLDDATRMDGMSRDQA
jgi:hypothetical protein